MVQTWYYIYLLVKLGSEQIIYFQIIIGFHLKHACICVVQKMALYFSFPYTHTIISVQCNTVDTLQILLFEDTATRRSVGIPCTLQSSVEAQHCVASMPGL